MDNLWENHKEFIKTNNVKIILKSQQWFRSKKHVFIEVNKIALSTNNDKNIETIDSIETYAYGMSKDIAKEEIKCSNIMKQYKNE